MPCMLRIVDAFDNMLDSSNFTVQKPKIRRHCFNVEDRLVHVHISVQQNPVLQAVLLMT